MRSPVSEALPANCAAERFLISNPPHHSALVVKPPHNTTTSAGRLCHRSLRPCDINMERVASLIGLPAASPYAKHALMIPANDATRIPRPKTNSPRPPGEAASSAIDRKSTRLNSSHLGISYAV